MEDKGGLTRSKWIYTSMFLLDDAACRSAGRGFCGWLLTSQSYVRVWDNNDFDVSSFICLWYVTFYSAGCNVILYRFHISIKTPKKSKCEF